MRQRPKVNNSAPDYSQATRRLQARKNPTQAAIIGTMDVRQIIRRLVVHSASAPMKVLPGLAFRIEERDSNPFTSPNSPYGILPELLTASPAELIAAADQYSVAKYEFLRRGDKYRSWQAAWRQRMIEQVLANITSIGIVSV